MRTHAPSGLRLRRRSSSSQFLAPSHDAKFPGRPISAVSTQPLFTPINCNCQELSIFRNNVPYYVKWFNAVGPDMIKEKMGDREGHNHYVNNPRGTVITSEMVLAQVEKYNQVDNHGHLYGAIIASVRDYMKRRQGEVRRVPPGFLCSLRGRSIPASSQHRSQRFQPEVPQGH